MRSPNEIMNYVASNYTHFLDVLKPGFLKKAPYGNTTYYGTMAFGCGANACSQELFLNENVIYAFTGLFKSYLGSDYVNAMFCFTDRGRIIVGYEKTIKSDSYQLYSHSADDIKWNDFVDGTSEIVVGNIATCTIRLNNRSQAKKVIDRLLFVIKKYAK